MTIRIVPILIAVMMAVSSLLMAAPAQAASSNYGVTAHTCKNSAGANTSVKANIYWKKTGSGSMGRAVTGISVTNPTSSNASVYAIGDNRQDVTTAGPRRTVSRTFSSTVNSVDPWMNIRCTVATVPGQTSRVSLGWM